MNNKPGEQRNNQKSSKQSINEWTTKKQQQPKSSRPKQHTKTVAIKQIQTIKTAIPKNNNGSTTNQKSDQPKITMAGTTKTVAAKTVTTIFGGGQNRNNRNNFNNQNRNRFNKKGKKGKHQQESAKPAVPARKFRELPDVFRIYRRYERGGYCEKSTANQRKSSKKLFMMGVMVNQKPSPR